MADDTETIDRSYGIIPIRLKGDASAAAATKPTVHNTEVLLILQKTIRKGIETYWTFPKGHPKIDDESNQHSAIRELYEETGLTISLDDILASECVLEEVYRDFPKIVRFWPALIASTAQVTLQEKEIADHRWYDWDQALATLTFEDTKGILREVGSMLHSGTEQ